jgi:hypothetical protein
MYARWATLAVGIGLMAAPLVLGYPSAGDVLHHVALGLLICIATLPALELPAARFALLAPAAWLLWSGRGADHAAVGAVELAAGALIAALSLVPSARLAPRVERGRASARA